MLPAPVNAFLVNYFNLFQLQPLPLCSPAKSVNIQIELNDKNLFHQDTLFPVRIHLFSFVARHLSTLMEYNYAQNIIFVIF